MIAIMAAIETSHHRTARICGNGGAETADIEAMLVRLRLNGFARPL
jgi:hypothetical protein